MTFNRPIDVARLWLVLGFAWACVQVSPVCRAETSTPSAEELAFFETRVRPVLAEHCYSCHSANATKLQAGLFVDHRAGLLDGGDSGTAIVPGDAEASLLIEAVRYEAYEMPPKGKLPDYDIAALERWVDMGAPWPDEEWSGEDAAADVASEPAFDLSERKSEHWAWQPIQDPVVPDVVDESWPRDPLDHFVLAKLEAAGLHPADPVDRPALLRRLHFDLIGLPPTPEETAAYLNDSSDDATARVVDRLLHSPHFGERWARHWLDLVRYAESRGHEFDNDTPNAHQYRDYVIRALNEDVPYDQFVREHIAGDLIEQPRLNPESGFNESILGTGFWFLGEWVHSPVDIRKDEAERFDNMIDVMSKTFLGMTVACARCHDHKFDAISAADYYSLSGFLQSSDHRQVRFESLEHNRKIATELSALDARYQSAINTILQETEVSLPETTPYEVPSSVVMNLANVGERGLVQDGFIFGDRPQIAGDPRVTIVDGKATLEFAASSAAANDPFWDELESISETPDDDRNKLNKIPRSGRTLRTPTFTLTRGKVAVRVEGSGHVFACVDSHRLIAGPLHGQTIKTIKPNQPWVELNLDRYVGHRIHLEFTPAKDSRLAVSWVTQGMSREVRKSLTDRDSQIAESVARFAQSVSELRNETLDELTRSWADDRARLQARVMRRSRLAIAMMDGFGEDDHVLIRGNASTPGEVVPRHFLTAIAGNKPMEIETGSGRLSLAAQINAPENSLSSRVIANRVWHHLMGRGIVATTDDFGVLGARPTHPELLDHLAIRFRDDGQSLKRMIRAIVLSKTYQMSGQVSSDATQADPKNELWHHRPPRRLQGEVIRDSLLALSGNLDRTSFGPPVPIHLTPFMGGRGRPKQSGPADGDGRRTIYVAVRRNFLSPFLSAFDTPTPFSAMGRRNVSNVPAQSLIMMNDPFIADQTRTWAERAIEARSSQRERIVWLYETAMARPPVERELELAVSYLQSQADRGELDRGELDLWADLAHALVNTKEFIFLR